MLRELIGKIASGEWSPHRPIAIPTYEGGAQQLRMIPLEDHVRAISQQNDIHPLKLYHMMQRKIYEDMLDRSNRSRIFKSKVFEVLCSDEGQCQLVEMFDDPIEDEFDYERFKDDRSQIIAYQKRMNDYESSLDSNQLELAQLIDLQDECENCMGHLDNHRSTLLQNINQYEPNYPDVWGHMATKGDAYYRDDIKSNPDPKYQAIATKQIDRVIPRNIQDVFLNATLIPILMKHENRMLLKNINDIYASLQEDAKKLKYLIRQIPESDEPSQKSLIESIFEGLGFRESVEDTGEDDPDEVDRDQSQAIIENVRDIVNEAGDEEVDEVDEDEDEEEEGTQEGGEIHALDLSFF